MFADPPRQCCESPRVGKACSKTCQNIDGRRDRAERDQRGVDANRSIDALLVP